MPITAHNAFVDVCQSDPSLVSDLLTRAFRLAPWGRLEPGESTFRLPNSVELRADLVLLADGSAAPM